MSAPAGCSALPIWSDARWRRRLQEAPSLVAETLERVRDPLPAWLRPGPPARPPAVAARLARSLLPPESADRPPPWLRADQRLSFARALAAVRRYGGALLADQPGTGKTWIGLAVAAALRPGQPVHVLAPATLRSQWSATAGRAGIEIRFHSHELLSRGKVPATASGPVILDESHRMRNPATRRYLTLAPWCVGRTGLLLSATPTVNRFEDAVHQLRLLVRDDALIWSGVPSLLRCRPAELSGELARLIVTGEDRSGLLPESESASVRVEDPSPWFGAIRSAVLALRLSRDPAIAALIRISLLGAFGSSPLAFLEALARYRSLLLHARDATSSGKTLSRQTIRQFAGAELDQLVFWPLVAEPSRGVELALEDLDRVLELEESARQHQKAPDPKTRALLSLIADHKRTLIFTNARATVRYLRRHLGSGVAWCTGDRSGIDRLEIPRDDVLDLFRVPGPRVTPTPPPRILLATDVAAEGLDLPLVARVVHYDLPWTAVRLEQRTGRALRLGSLNPSVEVVRLLPPAELESLLGREDILARKGTLPKELGLSRADDAPWRLRARIALAWIAESCNEGAASVSARTGGFVACVRIGLSDGSCEEFILARRGEEWLDDPAAIAGLLEPARCDPGVAEPNPREIARVLVPIGLVTRRRLRALRTGATAHPPRSSGLATLRRNLVRLGREAARSRDPRALALVQRGMQWLRRGHTAGESLLIQEWSRLTPKQLARPLATLPHAAAAPTVTSLDLPALLVISPKRGPR